MQADILDSYYIHWTLINLPSKIVYCVFNKINSLAMKMAWSDTARSESINQMYKKLKIQLHEWIQ